MYLTEAKSLLHMLWQNRRYFSGGLTLALLRSFVVAPLPWMFGMMVDRYVPTRDIRGLVVMSLLCLLMLVLHYVFSVTGCKLIGGNLTRLVRDMRVRIFNKMQFLSFGYLDQNATGRLISKYSFDTQRLQDVSLFLLNHFLPSTVLGLSVLAILVAVNWELAVVVILMMPILYITRHLFYSGFKQRNHHAREAQEVLTGKANELISALRLVRSLGQEKRAEQQLADENERVVVTKSRLIDISAMFGTFMYCMNQFVSVVVIAGGALLVIYDMMSLGTLMAFVSGVGMIMMPFNMLSMFMEQYMLGEESYSSVRELLNSRYVETWKGGIRLEKIHGEILFDGVSFAYPSKEDTRVLRDFSLHIRAGESVALVGPSGSGKSTVASLILGLYEADGDILIDRVPQRELHMRHFRKQCAVVMQENLLLSGSIRDNIRFAREDASEEEIHQAARAANAEEFILNLDKGYDTLVGERGAQLSGGQRQRLSIARAILRDPSILILDEATSALDNESERLIQEALERLAKGRTVITIAHRLSTVRNADRIVVLEKGQIIEQGSFDELAKNGTHFRELLRSQIGTLNVAGAA